MSDSVNHPSHYNQGKIEVIEFLEDKNLGFHLGNVVKYIARAGKKDPTKEYEDLKKAEWYLQRYLEIKFSNHPRRPNDMNAKIDKEMAAKASSFSASNPWRETSGNSKPTENEGVVECTKCGKRASFAAYRCPNADCGAIL